MKFLPLLLTLVALSSSEEREDLEVDLATFCMDDGDCMAEAAQDMYYYLTGQGYEGEGGALGAVEDLVEEVCDGEKGCRGQLYKDLQKRIHEDEML